MKKVFSLLLAVMLVMGLALPASAASEGTVTIHGENNLSFKPGSTYSATDLFDNAFKNLMPGDTVSANITISSGFYFYEDTLRVYMRAVPHNEDGNKPVVQKVLDDRNMTVEAMNAFLNQLDLSVYQGSKEIFKAKAGELDGLKDNVHLGDFRRGGKIQLRVELKVPVECGNEIANKIGEIDWLFTVEAFDDPEYDNPRTGDYIMIAVAVMAISGAALAVLVIRKRRRK